jgi:Zn-dependent alcohol dehydrogenase
VTTGLGAVFWTAKVTPGANVVVFGLGGIGLNVVQGARIAGADKIIGVDLNPARETLARKFGLTHFVNPKQVSGDNVDLVAHLVELTGGGADYSFECCGNVDLMRRRWSAVTAAGASRPSSASPARDRRSRPAPSSWSPGGSGAGPRSAARAAAPTCRGSWTGT